MITELKLVILLITLAQALSACGNVAAEAPNSVPSTQPPPALTSTVPPELVDPAAVVQSFYKAYNEGDVEAAMAFIADDIQCRGNSYINGSEAFRSFIQGDINSGAQIEISDLRPSQDKVIFNYKLHRSGSLAATGVDAVMQIKDGKLIYFEIN